MSKTFTDEFFAAMHMTHRRMAASLFTSLVVRGSTLVNALPSALATLSEGTYADLIPLGTLSRTTGVLEGRILGTLKKLAKFLKLCLARLREALRATEIAYPDETSGLRRRNGYAWGILQRRHHPLRLPHHLRLGGREGGPRRHPPRRYPRHRPLRQQQQAPPATASSATNTSSAMHSTSPAIFP